jgi:hypothetical protein
MSENAEWLRERAQAFNLTVYKHKLLECAGDMDKLESDLAEARAEIEAEKKQTEILLDAYAAENQQLSVRAATAESRISSALAVEVPKEGKRFNNTPGLVSTPGGRYAYSEEVNALLATVREMRKCLEEGK